MSIQDSAVIQDSLTLGGGAVLNMATTSTKQPRSAMDIQDWIVNYLAQLLEVDPVDVDVTIPFDRYGLDSAAAVGMTGELEDWLGYSMDPTLLYDYPTIESLVKHLVESMS